MLGHIAIATGSGHSVLELRPRTHYVALTEGVYEHRHLLEQTP